MFTAKAHTLTNLAKLTVQPQLLTVQDILKIARLLKKTPSEIFDSIFNELTATNKGLINECELAADEFLAKKNKYSSN
ncbi:hypothetical protein GCM10028808_57090 [Spirosoma migulaei]